MTGPTAAQAPALVVAGTGSDAGKSTMVAALCRLLVRRGVRVAPFKGQNMSLNAVIAADGGEVAAAQALQAAAARIEPTTDMNPVLYKPGSPDASHVILAGRAAGRRLAADHASTAAQDAPAVLAALARLRAEFELVLCEGAGALTEPNLREADLAGIGLAARADLPVVVVGDIERGGVFAGLYGAWAMLEPADRRRVVGFVINRFRGESSLLGPAIDDLQARTGVPVLGVVPWIDRLGLEAEDSLGVADSHGGPPLSGDGLVVAVLRLPWMANFTDLDPLAAEPGVAVVYTTAPAVVTAADLVVIPGTRATVAALGALHAAGLTDALRRRVDAGGPILGICGGYQLLGSSITDHVESAEGRVPGLGLLPVTTTFHTHKVQRRVTGHAPGLGGCPAEGYELRHGHTRASREAAPLVVGDDGEPGGVVEGPVAGTSWHGLLAGDEVRRALLAWVADRRGRAFTPGSARWSAVREAAIDRLADGVDGALDLDRLLAAVTTPHLAEVRR